MNPTKIAQVLAAMVTSMAMTVCAQQITVPRVEAMPNMPSPYQMRNWEQVALGYDSLVFNFSLTGTYLPLAWLNTNTVNYPSHNSFGLHTVVGTTFPTSAEAINCLPAVVGATLVGIDKSNQNGYNFVLMSEEWFNRRLSQNVYKNHPVDDSGDDFWYITMPNVFFYQLASLYPSTGDYNAQFTTVANRWLQALAAMGGRTTPWQVPNVDHRGWYFQTMTPHGGGVHEPETAGAIAWILYNAHVQTDSAQYRIGAEWAMEFLDSQTTNPSYELQLPYGTYLAARMNAELGTRYNVERMVNWCFDVGPLRSWGAMVGTWGGYDVSGLIGEVNGSNDYAFMMNTFEQIGTLVPMVRYDDRFARAIGKWVLNAANAARLLYTNYLPDDHQDSEEWSHQYDPNSYIAHEALRQYIGGFSPYATGDAITGGWGQTNLALYGSSHVGILGGIIDTTNVPMILKLDVLKTDYFHADAYPTFLYFNPYDSTQLVSVDVGSGIHDLYDAVTNDFLITGMSGTISLPITGNSVILLVVAPAGGTISYDLERMFINGVVVDYRSGNPVANHPPRVKALAADRPTVLRRDTTTIFCTAADLDNDSLVYTWQATQGTILGVGPTVRWLSPDSVGTYTIMCFIDDGRGGQDTAQVQVEVALFINHAPVITRLLARPRKIDLGASSQLTCIATDPDSDALSYAWSSNFGQISGSGPTVTWTAPSTADNYFIFCTVSDSLGGRARDSTGIVVRDFSQNQTGDLVAYYPFSGNANDSSGFNNNGTVYGAILTSDRQGNLNSAYFFNGFTSHIRVPNDSSLNFEQAISVNFWMIVSTFYTREQYPISHGNWENRWKVSISNQRLRWTVKTTMGIKDLDSESLLETNRWYNVTVLYSGSDYEVWLDGELDAFSSWSGTILTTSIDLTIGQVLPTNSNYNFHGTLDEIRIYNYALSVQEIQNLAGGVTSVDDGYKQLPEKFMLDQNFPNPFNPTTIIQYAIPRSSHVTLRVYDLLGREIAALADSYHQAGWYFTTFDASTLPSGVYFYRLSYAGGSLHGKMMLLR